MTTIANDTEVFHDDDVAAFDESDSDAGTELIAIEPALIGEIVDGPVHLNTGQDGQQLPFRAGLLDARFVHEPQGFKRRQMGDMDDLIASVRLFGVRAPLVVRSIGFFSPVDASGKLIEDAEPIEHFAVVKGERRRQAAIEAERFELPCFIADTDDDIQLILQFLELNDHHKDLEGIEQADAYQMLLDFGLSEQQIADARRTDVNQVRTAIKARALPATAQRALNAGTLTLDQALALEEFGDDPDAQNKLLDKLSDEYAFRHELSRLRDKRAYARNKEIAKAHLVLESVDVTPKPRGFGYDGPAVRADVLLDADGQPVDVEAVKTQPGFHAFVEKDGGQARTVVYCDDPAQRGYTRRQEVSAAHRGLSPEQIAAKELAEQQAKERLERLTLAATVRREFIVEKFGTAKGARALFLLALRAATLGKMMSRSADLDELYRALGGSDNKTLADAGEDRLRRSLVAKYICTLEYNLNGTTNPHRMWIDKTEAVAWYDELRQRKYPLTDDEQELYLSWTATATAATDDEVDEDQDDDEDDVTTPDIALITDAEGMPLSAEQQELDDAAATHEDAQEMPVSTEQEEPDDVIATHEDAQETSVSTEQEDGVDVLAANGADAVVIEAPFDRNEVSTDDTDQRRDLDEFSDAA
ncbi:ParB/RepB/Spo0J family partition protein [Actinoplanes rectilineatus]|uniref:ParB/RepB/Spo0J family partition protein n=1 Tax=Actinoplanes rectilineatus TaxID=113571 RepID=UPI0005F2D688|nr:ParB N-terminal domain-containing protein [Actinoplanes rectilineatus]